jgi:hypothetical protein
MSEEVVQQVEVPSEPAIKGKDLLRRLAGKVTEQPSIPESIKITSNLIVTKGWILVYRRNKHVFGLTSRRLEGRYLTARGELLTKLQNAKVFLVRREAVEARLKARMSYSSFLKIVQVVVTVSLKTRKPRRKKNENT